MNGLRWSMAAVIVGGLTTSAIAGPITSPYWATDVVSNIVGDPSDPSPWDSASRSNPANAIGAPDNSFYSLTLGGSLILEWDPALTDATAGLQGFVIEITGGNRDNYFEAVEVSFSSNLLDWTAGQTFDNSVGTIGPIAIVGVSPIRYVRLTDVTNAERPTDYTGTISTDGFDVDAVSIEFQGAPSVVPTPGVAGSGLLLLGLVGASRLRRSSLKL